MTNDINFIEMFEGLQPEEAKQLRNRIAQAVQNEYQNFKENKMPTEADMQYLEDRLAELKEAVGREEKGKAYNEYWERQEANKAGMDIWTYRAAKARGEINQGPPAFDAAGAQSKIDSLSREYERLATNPHVNIGRMEKIQTQVTELLGGIQKHNQDQAQAFLSRYSEERGKAERDITTLSSQIEQLSVNPGANWERLQSLHGEMEKRVTYLEQLDRGESPTPLEWVGG